MFVGYEYVHVYVCFELYFIKKNSFQTGLLCFCVAKTPFLHSQISERIPSSQIIDTLTGNEDEKDRYGLERDKIV